MRINLVLQHLKPYLVQLLFHLMLFRQGFDVSPGAGLHGAKGPDQTGNLILPLRMGVRACEIIFPNPSGILCQLHHGADNASLYGAVQPSHHQKGCRTPQDADHGHDDEQGTLHLIPFIA